MKERIQQFIDNKGISAGELASLLEVQRSNISHILNGRNKPGASLIEKMLLVFPELNARWLLTGEGDMLETSTSAGTVQSQPKPTQISTSAKSAISGGSILQGKKIDTVVLLYNDGTFVSYNKD
ncbi:MAG: helix-turn-helix transcriptional regulator [Prolixibacteraceae bacterium]|nr:helix-turn-helix transcriptional regulator [Prolixibacteraceae bacterium]